MSSNKLSRYKTSVMCTNGIGTVVYHSTPIVTWDRTRRTVTLDSGGWRTATTKTKMNQTSQEFDLGFCVYQRRGNWFVDTRNLNSDGVNKPYWLGLEIPFDDGMTIELMSRA